MTAYLGFASDLAKVESQVLSKAEEWGDDFKAAQGVVSSLEPRMRDQLAAEYLVLRLRDAHGEKFRAVLPQYIERRVTERGVPQAGRVQVLMEVLGVQAAEVKAWAVSVGLLDEVKRGRVSIEIVEAYGIAHTPKQEPLPEELTA